MSSTFNAPPIAALRSLPPLPGTCGADPRRRRGCFRPSGRAASAAVSAARDVKFYASDGTASVPPGYRSSTTARPSDAD